MPTESAQILYEINVCQEIAANIHAKCSILIISPYPAVTEVVAEPPTPPDLSGEILQRLEELARVLNEARTMLEAFI